MTAALAWGVFTPLNANIPRMRHFATLLEVPIRFRP
ncbi:hypothetical protein Poly30_52680 [Planctomycetes bacterium Poly30]|uniref:Uncharacterized protein n=1 Tax=Saltatorellus ferox TaxID=2528018 RepID=A0A518F057_9BACT|nr:hypothetical protein Poly30_52680 [Planctomycetes bacterium Poly30]